MSAWAERSWEMQLVGNIFVVVSTDRDGLEVNNSKTF